MPLCVNVWYIDCVYLCMLLYILHQMCWICWYNAGLFFFNSGVFPVWVIQLYVAVTVSNNIMCKGSILYMWLSHRKFHFTFCTEKLYEVAKVVIPKEAPRWCFSSAVIKISTFMQALLCGWNSSSQSRVSCKCKSYNFGFLNLFKRIYL